MISDGGSLVRGFSGAVLYIESSRSTLYLSLGDRKRLRREIFDARPLLPVSSGIRSVRELQVPPRACRDQVSSSLAETLSRAGNAEARALLGPCAQLPRIGRGQRGAAVALSGWLDRVGTGTGDRGVDPKHC